MTSRFPDIQSPMGHMVDLDPQTPLAHNELLQDFLGLSLPAFHPFDHFVAAGEACKRAAARGLRVQPRFDGEEPHYVLVRFLNTHWNAQTTPVLVSVFQSYMAAAHIDLEACISPVVQETALERAVNNGKLCLSEALIRLGARTDRLIQGRELGTYVLEKYGCLMSKKPSDDVRLMAHSRLIAAVMEMRIVAAPASRDESPQQATAGPVRRARGV